MDLLNICLTSTYFQYNGKTLQTVTRYSYGLSSFCCCSRNCHTKHRGTSPSYLHPNCTSLVTLCWRHIFTAIHKDWIDDFHEDLNRQNTYIQFTKEIKENGKISFLDCLVTCDNNKLKTTIYRKLTHTNRLLDQSSYNPTSQKATYPDSDETSAASLRLTWQPTRRDWLS